MLVFTDMRQRCVISALILLIGLSQAAGCWGGGFTREQKTMFDDGCRRHQDAKALLIAHDYELATEQFIALWTESTRADITLGTYYWGNLTEDISILVRAHPPARIKFEELREPTESRVLSGTVSIWEEAVWFAFTQMIGADDALVKYAERFQKDPIRMDRLSRESYNAFERLVALGRWDLAGWVYSDPVGEAGVFKGSYSSGRSVAARTLNTILSIPILPLVIYANGVASSAGPPSEEFVEAERKGFKEHMVRWLVRGGRIAAACKAAGREKEAKLILQQAVSDVGEERARDVFAAALNDAREAARK